MAVNVGNKCCNCKACFSVCPAGAISFISESKTKNPICSVNYSLCINCGLCETVCLIHNSNLQPVKPLEYLTGYSTSKSLESKSTSGGTFASLAEYVLHKGGIVYGASFSDQLKCQHMRISYKDELHFLQGSKYVESDTTGIHMKVKNDLELGLLVLFSGTPCQVVSIKQYLEKEYNNLITVDLICHGVIPQEFFDSFIRYFEKSNKCKVTGYLFRTKEKTFLNYSNFISKITLEKNSKVYVKHIPFYEQYYYFLFLKNYLYRPNCYECKFAKIDRYSDITVGDAWGIANFTKMKCSAPSLILVNTDKGKKLLDCIANFHLERIDNPSIAVNANSQLNKPSESPADQDEILSRYFEEGFINYFERNFKKSIFKASLSCRVPTFVKKILLKKRYAKK